MYAISRVCIRVSSKLTFIEKEGQDQSGIWDSPRISLTDRIGALLPPADRLVEDRRLQLSSVAQLPTAGALKKKPQRRGIEPLHFTFVITNAVQHDQLRAGLILNAPRPAYKKKALSATLPHFNSTRDGSNY